MQLLQEISLKANQKIMTDFPKISKVLFSFKFRGITLFWTFEMLKVLHKFECLCFINFRKCVSKTSFAGKSFLKRTLSGKFLWNYQILQTY